MFNKKGISKEEVLRQ